MRTSQFILLFLCSLIGFSGTVHAQDSLKLVPTISVDSLDLLSLQLEDDLRDQQGLAPRYAVPNLVEITAATHGHWEKLDDKLAMWRLRFTCKNAISMNFGFQRWLLPIDSEMMIYNVEGTHRIRPFTIDDYNDSGELWTPAVAGGDVIIEIRCPQNAVTLIKEEIKLTSVNAGYRGFHEAFGQQPLPNNIPSLSGSCNIDVACPESVGWENEIDCVGVISTGGSTFCTGFMVNNTSQDGTPYFMTADHCGIVSGNAPSLVVYWNYENSFCRTPGSAASGGPGDGVLNQFSTGSIYRAGSATSDFTLVELNSPPNAAFGVSFCGWDASTSAPTSAVGIHHPATDEKRISFENQPPSLSTNFVTVNDWDAGTTEPGSSGSPLFDQNHRVIGQLCCGGAACGNNLSDDYGRFSRSWNLGLAAWLDSAGTGQLFVDTLPAGGGGPVEQCSNGTDDDGDGLVDCNDPDCAPSPACGGGGGPGAPANDLCSDAQAVGEGVFAFDNTGSVLDGPNACDTNMGTDVWFAYTATTSGTATIETCGSAGSLDDTVLIVYDGGSCPPSPTCLASDDDGCTTPNFSSTVSVPVVAGNTYLIQVGGWNGATGNSDLSISVGGGPAPIEDCANGVDDDADGLVDCADPDCAASPACTGGGGPANDACANAIAVGEGLFAFDNTGAVLDGPVDCDANMGTDVWFAYTPSADGTANIATCGTLGSLDDSVLIVYDGGLCPPSPICLASNDDGCTTPNFSSTVDVPVLAGNTYLIQVGGWNGATGTSDLSISLGGGPAPVENCANGVDDDGDGLADCADPDCAADPACTGGGGPANDACANALAVGEGVFAFDNSGAVLDGPVDCDANMDTDVWFAYSPSASGTALIETCGTAGTLDDTVLIVYDGGLCPPSPVCLASDDDGCTAPNFSSTVAVPVTAGNTYLIQVGGWNGATGTSDLSISLGGGPLVEDCTNGVDDDGDGLADCADPDCATNPACGGGGGGNDECIGAIAMFDGPNFFDTTGLTNSADPVPTGCPNAFGGMNNDGWFTYTATSTGDAIFNTCDPAGFDTDLAIYAGDCSALALLGCDGDGSNLAGCQAFDSEVIVPVIAGETYVIRVGGFGATTAGLGTVTITVGAGPILEDCTNGVDDDGDGLADCADPDCATNPACGGGTGPANDLCIDAIPVAEGVFAYDNTGALLDGPIDCDANMSTDVWFLYTASSTGTATIGTCDAGGSQDDTVLIVYDGSFCPTAGDPCIASADDTCANTAGGAAFMSQVDIPVTAGSSYLVQVGGWNGTEGNGDLTISLGTGPGPVENCSNGTDDDGDGLIDCADDDCIGDPACGGGGTGPANDDCANAQAVGEGVFAFDNTGAILDGPTDCDTNMDTDVWFAYTPSASGTATIETCGTLGSMDDTVLIVYDGGTCPPSPACLASDDDGCTTPNFSSTVAVPVTAGNTYLIQVGGWNGATGNSDLSISLGGGPAPVENCTNGTDDDGDGFIDCEDTDCDQDPACTPPPVENCTNGTDDDGDGLADCADPDCSNDPSCITNGFSFIAQDASGTYSPDTGTGSFTGTVSASEDSAAPGYPNETQGFSFGLSHDATLLSANGFNTGAALNGLNSGSGPDFLDVNTYSDGVTVGCVYSFSSPGTVVLQLTSETVLGTIDYDTVPSGLIGNTAGTTTSLSWSNALGVPPVINIMVVGGQANPASLIDGTVTLDAAVGGFVRGDVNDDASINIADAVSLLAGLFTGGAIPCSDSADANDDGATNIADAVYVLANLFSGGPGMPAPTGPSCGPDPTADGLDCANYNSCP